MNEGNDVGVMGGGYYTAESAKMTVPLASIRLPFQIDPNSLYVNGVQPEYASGVPEEGQVLVGVWDTYTDVFFVPEDVAVGETVQLTYQRRATYVSVLSVLTTGSTARGSLTLTWPVMSSGTDCSQNAIIGFYHMKIPRVMVTQRPSLDTSRSTAATPQIVFSAIDAHRGDKKWYDLVYEPLDDGVPITEYGDTPFVWEN